MVGCFTFSFIFSSSFGLTESVDLFGQTNSVDLVLNDIWIEREKPNEGGIVVHGSVYNAGIIPSGEVSNVVTVGYIVNDEIVEINVLENILPGIENGIEISSGPIIDVDSGFNIVTVIINYHDTLSHLRDNQENNIVQKGFQIGTETPTLIKYDIYQNYDHETNIQKITVQGEVSNIFQEKLFKKKIILDFGDAQKQTTTNVNGEFLSMTDIPYSNKSIKVTAQVEDNFSFLGYSQIIYPLKLEKEQSAIALETTSVTDNFENSDLTIVVFQDSYDKLFKKISTSKFDNQSLWSGNSFMTILPANHEYIIEIYLEGRLFDAFQEYLDEGRVVNKDLIIPKSADIRFRVINENGEPQSNVIVNNWIYSAITDENGFTNWISVLPTTNNEPYAAKATFLNGKITWSEPFFIEHGERKVIQIIQESDHN